MWLFETFCLRATRSFEGLPIQQQNSFPERRWHLKHKRKSKWYSLPQKLYVFFLFQDVFYTNMMWRKCDNSKHFVGGRLVPLRVCRSRSKMVSPSVAVLRLGSHASRSSPAVPNGRWRLDRQPRWRRPSSAASSWNASSSCNYDGNNDHGYCFNCTVWYNMISLYICIYIYIYI